MGRKTWDSLKNKPLPNRLNIVLSKKFSDDGNILANMSFGFNSYVKANCFLEDMYRFFDYNMTVYIIGGEQIYNLYLPIVDTIILSTIPFEFDGDSYFKFNERDFVCQHSEKRDDFNIEYWSRKILEK